MTYIPFAQSQTWAQINKWFNDLEPVVIECNDVWCLFGLDKNTSTLTAFNGPVVPLHSGPEKLHLFLQQVLEYAKKNKIFHINFRGLCPLRKYAELEDAFTKLRFKKQNWNTIIIDLHISEDELLKNFKHAARKSIKRANSLGMYVELCNSFEQYYTEFWLPFCALKKRTVKDKDFYKYGWDLDQENIYRYWIAKAASGEPLGYLGTYSYKGVATEIMSALTPLAIEAKMPAQDLLHYEIIKFHKNLGDDYFDLAGFNPHPKDDKELNIRRFKEKWGSTVYDTSTYTLDRRTIIHKITNKIKRKIYG